MKEGIYETPTVNDFELIGTHYYYTRYIDGYKYNLLTKQSNFGSIFVASKGSLSIDNELINQDYWSLLSPKAVQYSASVIDFFFKEAEGLKDEPRFAKRESFFAQVVDVAKNIVSIITGTAENIIGTVKDNAQIQDPNLLASVSLDGNPNNTQPNEQETAKSESVNDVVAEENNLISTNEAVLNEPKENILIEESVKNEVEISPEEDSKKLDSEVSTSTQAELVKKVTETNTVQEPIIQTCSFQTAKIATYQGLLINEVAWMGSIKSSNDEWFELKNISGSESDISNWQILDKDEQIKITFPKNTKISAGGYLLLERTDDNSVPNVKADIVYTGSLSNSDEGLRLFDKQCNLIDEVMAGNDWSAGDSSVKKTMERQSDLSWSTYVGSGEGVGNELILGTPKKENSLKVISYGAVSVPAPVIEKNDDTNTQQGKILISEIQITGGTGKTNNDFIEFYNPNDSRVNLNGYRLVKRTKIGVSDTSIKSWTDDAYIEAKSFYLWANSEYTNISVSPDITTSGTLANDNGVALRFGAEDTGVIIDSVAWGEAANIFVEKNSFAQNLGANQSIQRTSSMVSGQEVLVDTDNNADDFQLTGCPNPKARSRFCELSETNESNQAPSAFFVLSTTTPKISDEIIIDASSSTDSDGTISLYDWNFGDNSVATSTQATTTHSYLLAGDYNIYLTIFDNLNATSTYTSLLSVASSTIQDNNESGHVVISEIMAGLGSGRSDEEFIELYNPTSEEIDLTGYSLKRRSSISASTTQNLVRDDDFASTTIKAYGFFLIASNEYQASSTPDVYYSNSSYHLAYDDDAIVLYDINNQIIDEVDYESIEEGKSLERKSLVNNICFSTQSNDGKFLGNSCDNDEIADFEISNISNPQNTNSYSEPRTKPITVTNFIGKYDKVNKKINLSWDESSDCLGATSTLTYLISDNSLNPVFNNIETASTTAEFNISETNRDYIFDINAIDRDGFGSDVSTTTVFVPGVSIEDVNYFIFNQNEIVGSSQGLPSLVFKPLATGINESITLNISNTVQHGGLQGISNVDISLYEWVSESATTSPNIGKGQLLARSSAREFYANTSGSYVWSFDNENQVLLDATKYYYLQINIIPVRGDLSFTWGMAGDNIPYLIIKAVENGSVIINDPDNNYIYQDVNMNFIVKYSEPFNNKYENLIIEVKDFYTDELVSTQTIALSDSEKTIGWHEVNGNLNMGRPGYFKLITSLSDLSRSEINFSIFGAVPAGGKLLDQIAFINNLSASSIAQSFKPAVSGQLDSITLKLSTGGNGWNYTSLKIYEWIGGQTNSLDGSKGQLLATSESKMIWNNSLPGEGGELIWQFNDENEINLNSDSYYYLESVIDSQSNGGAPGISFKGSSNDSLIDGKLYSGNGSGDLYLIINAVQAR